MLMAVKNQFGATRPECASQPARIMQAATPVGEAGQRRMMDQHHPDQPRIAGRAEHIIESPKLRAS